MTDVPVGARVYFDTTVFCEAIEGPTDKAELLKATFDLGRSRAGRIVTSELTLAELAAGDSWPLHSRFYLNLIVFNSFIDLKPVSRTILYGTGDYRRAFRRSDRNMKLPDAIHAVTAIQAGCRFLLTSDRRLPVPQPLTRVSSEPEGLRLVEQALVS